MTPHLIIAGTEKAGTSSVYQYLAAHRVWLLRPGRRLTISDFIPVRSVSTSLTFLLRKGVMESPLEQFANCPKGVSAVICLEHQQTTTVCHAPAIDPKIWPYL